MAGNGRPAVSVEEFWSRFNKIDGGCWEWKGAVDKARGYGIIHWRGQKKRVHQVAYELAHGPMPEGKITRHTCDNRICGNPEHLISGTQADNVQDMHDRGRSNLVGGPSGANHYKVKLAKRKAEIIAANPGITKGELATLLTQNLHS